MATNVFSKQDFIEFIKKSVEDQDYVLVSSDFTGSISAASGKKPVIKIGGFQFAGAAFSKSGDVGCFQQGDAGASCFIVASKHVVSEAAIKLVESEAAKKKGG